MRNIILGTDWCSDCDDVVAVRILSKYVKENKINLLGIGINACMDYSVASLKGFLSTEGLNDVKIGIDHNAVNFEDVKYATYQENLAKTYCDPMVKNEYAPDAVQLYRMLIANSEGPVEIMEIGFLQVIADVLKSEPDDISPLNGIELVKEKVSKIWVMAGHWDKEGGREHNFCLNECTCIGGSDFCEMCPVPVTFLGWEIGVDVITGDKLSHDDPLHKVFVDFHCPEGRSSWDPMLVLMALIGDEEKAGYTTVTGKAILNRVTGENHFEKDPDGLHKFVVKMHEDSFYADQINIIIS